MACLAHLSALELQYISIHLRVSITLRTTTENRKSNVARNQVFDWIVITFIIALCIIIVDEGLFLSVSHSALRHLHFNSYLVAFFFRNKKFVFFFSCAACLLIRIGTEHDLAVFMAIEQRENQSGDFAALQRATSSTAYAKAFWFRWKLEQRQASKKWD